MKVNLPRPVLKRDSFGRTVESEVVPALREIEQAFDRVRDFNPGTHIPSNPPALSTSPGVTGTITWDATHLYVCIATDTWVRCSLATF